MHEPHLYDTKQIYLQLDNAMQFRLCTIEEIKDSCNAETNNQGKMSKTLNKCSTVLNYAELLGLFCQG